MNSGRTNIEDPQGFVKAISINEGLYGFNSFPDASDTKKILGRRTKYIYSPMNTVTGKDITDYKFRTKKYHNYNNEGLIKVFSTSDHFFRGALCDASA